MSTNSRPTITGMISMALLPLGLLGIAVLATGCDLLTKGSDSQKAAANPAAAMSSGTGLTSDVPLTSDTALTSGTGLTSDTALTSDAALTSNTAIATGEATAADASGQPGNEAAVGNAAVTSVGYFHQRLAPYGRWVASESYGEVWVPRVASIWRPYRTGHWAYTDQGWAWVADETWGWATFHYGRWYWDTAYGWTWVPGAVWAPAWVAWRDGGGYLGWAALPPTVGFTFGVGLDLGSVEIAPSYWAFVPEGAILAPSLAVVIVAPDRNEFFYRGTTNITRYSVVNGQIVNEGIGVGRIEQITGRPVPRMQIAELGAARAGVPGGRLGGNRLGFYRPAALAGAAMAAHAEFGRALHAQVAAEKARGLVTGGPRGGAGALAAGRHLTAQPARGLRASHGTPGSSVASRHATSHAHTAHTGSASASSRSTHTSSAASSTASHSTHGSTQSTRHSTVHPGGTTSSSSSQGHQRSAPPPHQAPPPKGHKPPP